MFRLRGHGAGGRNGAVVKRPNRSTALYRRAAAVLPPTALDAEHAKALAALLAARRCTIAALLRGLLAEEASRLRANPVNQPGP